MLPRVLGGGIADAATVSAGSRSEEMAIPVGRGRLPPSTRVKESKEGGPPEGLRVTMRELRTARGQTRTQTGAGQAARRSPVLVLLKDGPRNPELMF